MASVLHVELEVKEGAVDALLETYRSTFRPAITRQEGFRAVRLLRPLNAPGYRLVIEFAEEAQRLRWVASDLHQQVWPQVESHCSGYTPNLFSEVEG
ncbi:MAG: antibiotic biosynthesis monooxygenase [Candidatus Dormibacteraeota bacterium]|nr:antibiotic biosynthesis monooxygenase [Candidatus Dormibacteraeota bacterium]MBO0745470.1 antibiotic biosynthesis monooxygenase [Candidatus Dormibacteraeota bacterium]